MKTFFFFSALILSSLAFSQGNLQFNQVLSLSGSYSAVLVAPNQWSYISNSALIVPNGKVWKVEMFSISSPGSTTSRKGLLINNNHILGDGTGGPFWLKAGDELKFSSSCSNCYSLSGTYFISAIEFNIIP